MKHTIYSWVCLVLIFTAFAITSYFSTDTVLKANLYVEQDMILNEAIDLVESGKKASSLVEEGIDITNSDACFVLVYDNINALSYSSAKMKEEAVFIPIGYVVHDSLSHNIYAPENGIRYALSTKKYKNGHIVVGKSIRHYDETIAAYQESMKYWFGIACAVALPILYFVRKIFHLTD